MIIVILIIIIIVVIIVLFLLTRDTCQENFSTSYNYEKIKPKLKTGDIILFSYKKHHNAYDALSYYCRTSFLGSRFGHAAIVIRKGKKLYGIECTDINHVGENDAEYFNNEKKGGVRIIDLDLLIKKYYEDYHGTFGVRFISQEIPNRKLIKHFSDYDNVIFQDKGYVTVLLIIDTFISHDIAKYLLKYSKENRMVCTEFMHDILNKCGELNDYPSKLLWPHSVGTNKFDKIQKNNYSEIFRFTYD